MSSGKSSWPSPTKCWTASTAPTSPRLTVYNKCDKPGALSFDPDILLTSAKTGYGLDKLLAKLDETLSDRVHTIRVLLPYDKLGLAAPMRERGSVQLEEYREDGLYLEGIVKTETSTASRAIWSEDPHTKRTGLRRVRFFCISRHQPAAEGASSAPII